MQDFTILTKEEAEKIKQSLTNLHFDLVLNKENRQEWLNGMYRAVLVKQSDGNYKYGLSNKTYLLNL